MKKLLLGLLVLGYVSLEAKGVHVTATIATTKKELNKIFENYFQPGSFNEISTQKLFYQILQGDLTGVNKQNAYIKNARGSSILVPAALSGSIRNIEKLSKKYKIKIQAKSNKGQTLMAAAAQAQNGQIAMVRWLMTQGLSINSVNSYKTNALLFAALGGNIQTVKWLMEKKQGLSINSVNSYKANALLFAALGGQIQTVKWLMEKKQGLSINSVDNYNRNALLYAALGGQILMVRWLMTQGLSIKSFNSCKANALLLASQNGQIAMVRWLMTQGLSINSVDNYNRNALLYAALGGQILMVRWLMTQGLSINSVDNYKFTALMKEVMNSQVNATAKKSNNKQAIAALKKAMKKVKRKSRVQ